MKKVVTLILIIAVTYLSCKNEKREFTSVKTENDSIITIIFKQRTLKKDTLISNSGGKTLRLNDLSYSFPGDFREFQIPKNNLKTNDTVKINSKTDIILSHGYHYYFSSLYQFKPGDTVIFEYFNDAPNCKIINRNVSNEELNFFKNFNLKTQIVEDEGIFFLNNKRFRTNEEKEKAKKDNLKILQLKIVSLDSLHKLNRISDSTYKIYNDGFNFQIESINSTVQNKLEKVIDLSLQYNRFNLIENFNTIYKPVLVKEGHGSHYDSKKQFDDLLQFKKINPKNKDFLLYHYFQDIAQYASDDEIKKYFIKFSEAVTEKKLIKDLSEKFLIDFSSVKKSTKEVYLLTNKRQKIDLDGLKSNFKGKVLYIDFWASWCAPCRVSMPSSIKLQEKFKNKDIAFIYISIDVDFEKWQEASKKESISLGNNTFLALNYPNAIFYKQVQLKSIPRYMIFDKKGNLVNSNAPNPESNEIVKELNKYLIE